MHLNVNNVNDAFRLLVTGFVEKTLPITTMRSRYGDVMRISEPVTISYSNPTERVLTNRFRDCNPFFHLYESLWMLAGRNDVAPLVYYNSKMKEFSDDGETFFGAYGYRWRNHFQEDQLNMIIDELQVNPDSRRCVLSMWDPYGVDDSISDLKQAIDGTSKDVPCNTHVYFQILDGALEMTVCNRSNDLIWGSLGANVVHLSFLQEYVANCVGVAVGRYHQFSTNLHAYTKTWKPGEWLKEYEFEDAMIYPSGNYCPLVSNRVDFERQLRSFAKLFGDPRGGGPYQWSEPFLSRVAQPMLMAYRFHKARNYTTAYQWMDSVQPNDWKCVGRRWLHERAKNWAAKTFQSRGIR